MLTSLWCLVIAAAAASRGVVCSEEHKTIRDLFAFYPGTEGRPVRDHRHPVDISVGYQFLSLTHFNRESGIASLYGWLVQEWTDEFLQWGNSTPSYSNRTYQYRSWNSSGSGAEVDRLNIHTNNIWKADLTAYNALKEDVVDDTRAVVLPSGYVIYVTPMRHDVMCSRHARTFWCSLIFGSWTYHSGQVNLHERSKQGEAAGIDLTYYTHHPAWHVDAAAAHASLNTTTYDCCPGELYPALHVNFSIEQYN